MRVMWRLTGIVALAMFGDSVLADSRIGAPRLVSRGWGRHGATGESSSCGVTRDGRAVMYWSGAENIAHRDRNETADVFVSKGRGRMADLASADSTGYQGNYTSQHGGMSGDGAVVVFESASSNLVCDGYQWPNVYVRNRKTGETARISSRMGGGSSEGHVGDGACVSADGRFVVFYSPATDLVAGAVGGVNQVYMADIELGMLARVSSGSTGSAGDGNSVRPSISANGRYVVYESSASNLVIGDTNGVDDVFVYDRESGVTHRVSVSSSGSEGNGNSWRAVVSDGGIVAFDSEASNLVTDDTNGVFDVFLHDSMEGETRRISLTVDGGEATEYSYSASISGDGESVVFTSAGDGLVPQDDNGKTDVYVYDVPSRALRLLSTDVRGRPGNGDSLSGPGALSVDGS